METKTHWKKQFNYEYLGAHDLPEGKDIVLTIQKLDRKDVANKDGKKESCLVCYFAEHPKPMVLNRTNCKTITKITGSPLIEDWPGKTIQVGAAQVKAFGEMSETLRVRQFAPKRADQKPTIETGSAQWVGVIDAVRQGYTLEQVQSKYTLTNQQIKLINNEIKGA